MATIIQGSADSTFGGTIESTGIDDNATSTAITIDANENVGIGTTPESWNSGWKTLQIGDGASIAGRTVAGNVDISSNAYRDLTDNRWEYIGANGSEEAAKYTQFDGTHVFYTAPAGSADAAITFSTKATIDTDGLKFNGDTAAANALDDYETGDFTITLSSGATTTPTYTGCRYTKIGNIVHVDVGIGFAGITCDATAIQVTGLPFAPVNRILVPANCYQRVNFDSAKNQFWYIEAASTTLDLKEATTNTNSVSTVPSQSGSFSPLFDSISFSYRAD